MCAYTRRAQDACDPKLRACIKLDAPLTAVLLTAPARCVCVVFQEEGVRNSANFLLFLSGDPDIAPKAPVALLPAAAAPLAVAVSVPTTYLHVVLQPPPLLVGAAAARVQLHTLADSLERRVDGADRAEWVANGQYPICISDGTSPGCDVESDLRSGRAHGIVWFGKGDGWEARHAAESTAFMPSLQRIARILAPPDQMVAAARAPPRLELAVVCLEFGEPCPALLYPFTLPQNP